ncbi:MAG: hypothetical protein ACRDRS_18265 [Pseudonocardiaceae bacterium]
MDVIETESQTLPRQEFLGASASLMALVAGIALVSIADRARFAHVRETALSCGNWSSFAMPATVFSEGWAALLLFGMSAWLAWAELFRPQFFGAPSPQEESLIVTTVRILVGLLALGASLMILYGAVDVYQTHQQALPPLRQCSP